MASAAGRSAATTTGDAGSAVATQHAAHALHLNAPAAARGADAFWADASWAEASGFEAPGAVAPDAVAPCAAAWLIPSGSAVPCDA